MKKGAKEFLIYSGCFALSYFAYVTILAVQDAEINRVLGAEAHAISHYLKILPRALGFMSFFLLRKLFQGERARKYLIISVYLIFTLSMLAMYIPDIGIIRILPFISSLALGHLWGALNYIMAMGLLMNPMRGRIFGTGAAMGVILQVALQNSVSIKGNILFSVLSAIIFIAIIVTVVKPSKYWIFENPLEFTDEDQGWKRSVQRQIIIAAVILLIINFLCIGFDTHFTGSFAASSLDIYGAPRLMFAGGFLLAGFMMDHKGGQYFKTALFAVFLLSVSQLMMPFIPGFENGFLSLYYFYAAFYVFFTMLPWYLLAGRSKDPEFFSSFGMALSDILEAVSAMIIMFLLKINESMPFISMMVLILLLILLYLILNFSGFDPDIMPAAKFLSDNAGPADFLSSYPLTPREREVAILLITTDKAMKVMAGDLGISERSLYRYTKSIYEKTSTLNRTELVKKYLS